jgi:MEMO1 family protein
MLSELAHGNPQQTIAPDERPALRDLEAIPFTQDGRTAILLRDPLQIGKQAVAVPPDVYCLMLRFDGTHTIDELREEFSRHSGQAFGKDQFLALLRQLNELLFLDNDRFRRRKALALREFRAQTVRSSAHSGVSYPEDPAEVNRMLSSLYVHPDGAGLAGTPTSREVKALIAPHIDLRLGGPTYTHTYRFLRESILPERLVILGIGHMGLPEFFSIARKDFQTPLGTTPCDREYISALEQTLGPGTFGEDLIHRTEHSIEFQVLFLQHVYEDRKFSIVPVLTSFSYSDLLTRQGSDAKIRRMIDAFRRAEENCPKRTCYIASVDLAHLGPRYGDDQAPTASVVSETMDRDRRLLETVTNGDSEGFLSCIAAEHNRRQVCGFSAIYTLLRLFPGMHGRMLAQDYCRMDETGSVVTYASLAFAK